MNAKTDATGEVVNILIVEDSPTQAEHLKYLLEQHSYSVTVANNGMQALAHIGNHTPTLVITDIVMPEMSGYELCQKIKAEEKTKDIPVILLTSLSSTEDVLEGLACGADNFISKPYSEQYLLTNIVNILVNAKLRKSEYVRLGMEIQFGGKKRFITADQQQMLSMLISTYEAAVNRNKELIQVQQELTAMNERLEELVDERTAALIAEVASHKLAEDALRVSEQLLKEAQKVAQIGHWELEPKIGKPRWSEEVFHIFGLDPKDGEPSFNDHKSLLYPDDWPMLNKAVTKASTDGTPFDIQFRIVKPNGEVKWIRALGSATMASNSIVSKLFGTAQDITEYKQVEEALRKSENKYRLLAENVNDVIFVLDMNLNYTFVSPSVKILRGYELEELLNKPLTETLTPASMDLAVKNLSEIMELERIKQTEVGKSRTLQLEMKRKDGTTVWTEVKLSFIRDEKRHPLGIMGVTRDITERRLVEDTLRSSERRLSDIIEFFPDATLVIDNGGKVIAWNRAIEIMTGIKQENMLGKGNYEYAIPFYGERRPIMINLAINPQLEINKYYTELKKTGNILFSETLAPCLPCGKNYLSVTASVLRDGQGRVVAAIECVRDITERKRADEELKQTLNSLKKAFGATIQVLVSSVEARDPYTAGHQLRSASLACAIAAEMGLAEEQINGIRMAGSIHDIGKLSIPSEILTKPAKLAKIEFSLIEEHSRKGYEMVKDVESPWPLAQIIYQHHERMNGTGYPRKLKGDEILMEARIMAVADVVESMASHRPYRPALGIEAALEEMEKNRGTLYDNAVVDACLKLFREKGYKLPVSKMTAIDLTNDDLQ